MHWCIMNVEYIQNNNKTDLQLEIKTCFQIIMICTLQNLHFLIHMYTRHLKTKSCKVVPCLLYMHHWPKSNCRSCYWNEIRASGLKCKLQLLWGTIPTWATQTSLNLYDHTVVMFLASRKIVSLCKMPL